MGQGEVVVRIFFMRHSESCSNVLPRSVSEKTDYVDPELTTRGHAMAEERATEFFKRILGRLEMGRGRDRDSELYVCSTPLLRAQQTAQYFVDGWVDYDEIIVLPYIKDAELSPVNRKLLARTNTELLPAAGKGPHDVRGFLEWLSAQMKPGVTRLLCVTHKGFLRKLSAWLLGREIEYGNLDGVEVVVRGGVPRIVGPPIWRYQPSRSVPRDACGRSGEAGCRLNVCALRRSRGRKTRKIRK
jgi:broad specificity phosphatase PhoE